MRGRAAAAHWKEYRLDAERDAIFLTGATGLIGGLLLRRLVEEMPGRTIYALVRNGGSALAGPGVQWVAGDITYPRLGLARDEYSRLCRSIRTIVHCAASTKLDLPLDLSREVNLQGTSNVMALARHCAELKLLLHVSSTYIAGRRSGPLAEELLMSPGGWFSPYEQSKYEAERLVSDSGEGLAWTIVRLSTVIGDSRTGHVSRPNYFHQLLRMVPRNPFPFIPGDPDGLVDVVADDWVTDGLMAILEEDATPGAVYHLCAGPSQSLPAREVIEMAFRSHLARYPGCGATSPRFVGVERFQSLRAGIMKRGDARSACMAELLLLCLPHLSVGQTFLNEKTGSFLERRGIVAPQTRDFLPRIIGSYV